MENQNGTEPVEVDTLITDAHILTCDPAGSEYLDGAVVIDGGRIVEVGPSAEIAHRYCSREMVDGRGRLCLPGLINAHLHPAFFLVTSRFSSRTPSKPGLLSRGGDLDRFLALFGGVDRVGLTVEETRTGALAGLVRVLRGGCTFVNDGGLGELEGVARALGESGMRGIATYGGGGDLDFKGNGEPPESFAQASAFLRKVDQDVQAWHGSYQGRVRAWYEIPTDLNASDGFWQEVKALADDKGVGVSSHVATVKSQDEMSMRLFGLRGVERMQQLGLLAPNWMGIHMGFVDDAEIGYLAEAGASVVHCPATSMGSGKGTALTGAIPRMIERGVTVALGSDSPNWGDMIQQMQLAFYVHKEAKMDDLVMLADEVLAMATTAAAKSVLWEDDIGSLEAGKKADLTLIDIDQTRYASLPHPLLGLMRAGHGGDVDSVMVDGKFLVRGGELTVLDEGKVLAEARQAQQAVLARL